MSKKSLLAKLDAIQEAHQAELVESRRKVGVAHQEIEEAMAHHRAEMDGVDAKVRRVLAGKDAEIFRLESRARSAEARAAEAEAAMRDLHAGLV